MVFEYRPIHETGLLAAFGDSTGSVVENGRLTLANTVGKGYIQGFDLSPSIKMMVHHYVLTDELVFRRIAAKTERDTLTLTFHNVLSEEADRSNGRVNTGSRLPSVQVTSANMDFETIFPAQAPISTIIIAVRLTLLHELIHPSGQHAYLQTIMANPRPYLYEEISSPDIQDVAALIVRANVPEPLQTFYYRLKAEELIYLFLLDFLRRQDVPSQPLRTEDVKQLYTIRDKLMTNLPIVPNLPELARLAGMSESKMTRLFRQIFGSSIYDYFQTVRMQEAAYLLREQKLSVSEVGYRLGFSNLSHFGRLFEKHTGFKPKKYVTRL